MPAEYSRPATVEDLKRLLRALHEHDVPYLLIGGYALLAHGYVRATVDIDLLLPPTLETGRAIKDALRVLPDGAANAIDPAWFPEGETIRVADEFVVDLMFTAAGKRYADLLPFAETLEFEGVPIRTVNLQGLLLTKQTVRDKDRADRSVLEAALRERGA